MKRIAFASLLVTLVFAAVVVAADANPVATAAARCGNVTTADGSAGAFGIRVSRASCNAARRIARAYVFRNNAKPLNFRCSSTQIGDEVWRAVCKRGKRWVRFTYGA